jgi:predicted dienelactone hydrolase
MRRLLLALATTLLATHAASAATNCLKDDFALGDQRAFAALRTATEATCPCAAATSRGTYQRCARSAVETAVGTGALRPACRATAKKIAREASCGSALVPCGRVRATDGDVSCKLARPAACADGGKIAKTACTAETHCADVVDWSAGTCHDVRDDGPYAVGFRQVQYVKDSVVSPGTPRVLDTAIWYPALPGGAVDPTTGGIADAPVDASGGPYPIVLFSHGSCGYPLQSTFLTPLLASYGFVVVAPPHPGNTLNELPACRTADAQLKSFIERPQDVRFVLDQVLAAASAPGSFLTGLVDPDRIAMTGHSFGGLTTYLVQAADPRIDVAVAMAPATVGAPRKFTVPSLIMLGNIDSIVDNDATRGAYAASSSPKYLVEIEHAGHFAFSDFCFPTSDCQPPVTLTSAEANAAALRYVVPFLLRYLAGDESWTPLLAPAAQPGFLFTAG